MEVVTGNCLPELAQTPDSERQEFCKVLDRPSDAAHMQKGRERDSMLMHLASTAVEVDSKAQQQIVCSSGGCSAERSECSSRTASAAAVPACRATRPLMLERKDGKEPSQVSRTRSSGGISTTCRHTPRGFMGGGRYSGGFFLPAEIQQSPTYGSGQ